VVVLFERIGINMLLASGVDLRGCWIVNDFSFDGIEYEL